MIWKVLLSFLIFSNKRRHALIIRLHLWSPKSFDVQPISSHSLMFVQKCFQVRPQKDVPSWADIEVFLKFYCILTSNFGHDITTFDLVTISRRPKYSNDNVFSALLNVLPSYIDTMSKSNQCAFFSFIAFQYCSLSIRIFVHGYLWTCTSYYVFYQRGNRHSYAQVDLWLSDHTDSSQTSVRCIIIINDVTNCSQNNAEAKPMSVSPKQPMI